MGEVIQLSLVAQIIPSVKRLNDKIFPLDLFCRKDIGMTKFAASPRYKDPVSGTEWANAHTFHIANWMLNDVVIYEKMKLFMIDFDGPIPYRSWIKEMGLADQSTSNGWKLMADGINYGELSEVMRASMY